MTFVSGGMGDLPATIVSLRVVAPGRGTSNGQALIATNLGGPYVELNGEEKFILLPYSYVQRKGDRVLAFLTDSPARGQATPPCPGWSMFKLDPSGLVVSDQPGAKEAGVAGRDAAEVLRDYR